MSAQLIVEGTADEFAFRHALTREAVGALHRAIASTLDPLGISHYVAGEYRRSIEFYSRAVLLFREVNDKGGLLTALAIGSSCQRACRMAFSKWATTHPHAVDGDTRWQDGRPVCAIGQAAARPTRYENRKLCLNRTISLRVSPKQTEACVAPAVASSGSS